MKGNTRFYLDMNVAQFTAMFLTYQLMALFVSFSIVFMFMMLMAISGINSSDEIAIRFLINFFIAMVIGVIQIIAWYGILTDVIRHIKIKELK